MNCCSKLSCSASSLAFLRHNLEAYRISNATVASEEGVKPLKAAIRDSRHGVATMLLNLPDMDPNQLVDDMGNTLLTAAISSDDHSLTLLLLRQPGIDISKANAAGETPIALAMQELCSREEPALWAMQGRALVELLNTYHSQGHSYSDVVTRDLALFFANYEKDENIAWTLSWHGIIQNCRCFQGPLCQLQTEHLNRLYQDFRQDSFIPKSAIHVAAQSGHIETVTFLFSLRNAGLDIHARVR